MAIDPANGLQRKVETLTIEKFKLDRISEKMLKMEQMYQKYIKTILCIDYISIWKQCDNCSLIVTIYEAKKESTA